VGNSEASFTQALQKQWLNSGEVDMPEEETFYITDRRSGRVRYSVIGAGGVALIEESPNIHAECQIFCGYDCWPWAIALQIVSMKCPVDFRDGESSDQISRNPGGGI
jgi:hypothetical protein